LPLTPSGKLDRRALPEPDHLRPELEQEFVAPRTERERILAEIWADVLGVEQVGIYDNFFDLGGDSITSIQVVARAANKGIALEPTDVLRVQTVHGCASKVTASIQARAPHSTAANAADVVPLTPIQRWFFDLHLGNVNHFNQEVVLECAHLNPELLGSALEHAVLAHPTFSHRFRSGQDGWEQRTGSIANTLAYEVVDLSKSRDPAASLQDAQRELNSHLDIRDGPALLAAYFPGFDQFAPRILLTAHHLYVDAVSWQVLLSDTLDAYQTLASGRSPSLDPEPTTYQDWSIFLQEQVAKGFFLSEVPYWESVVARHSQAPSLADALVSHERRSETLSVLLSERTTSSISRRLPHMSPCRALHGLVAALGASFGRWDGSSSMFVDIESHGRAQLDDAVDLSRTVGWFTSIAPLCIDISEGSRIDGALAARYDIERMPNNGVGFGVLRYLASIPSLMRRPHPRILLNYLGYVEPSRSRTAVRLISTGGRHTRDSDGHPYPLEINAAIRRNRLRVDWDYDSDQIEHDQVDAWASLFVEAANELADEVQALRAPVEDLSAFPRSGLPAGDLRRFLRSLEPST
jgi:non-ribosomal peptide synthase protein (TIGR01720 family)